MKRLNFFSFFYFGFLVKYHELNSPKWKTIWGVLISSHVLVFQVLKEVRREREK
jgi:hypothetical protein